MSEPAKCTDLGCVDVAYATCTRCGRERCIFHIVGTSEDYSCQNSGVRQCLLLPAAEASSPMTDNEKIVVAAHDAMLTTAAEYIERMKCRLTDWIKEEVGVLRDALKQVPATNALLDSGGRERPDFVQAGTFKMCTPYPNPPEEPRFSLFKLSFIAAGTLGGSNQFYDAPVGSFDGVAAAEVVRAMSGGGSLKFGRRYRYAVMCWEETAGDG